ncbi:hypothetical protein, partial [Streptomyces lavenduligriseus]
MSQTQSPGTQSVEDRIERLKVLLTGQSSSSRVVAGLARSSDSVTNLLLGVALHAADQGRDNGSLTWLEWMLTRPLFTVLDQDEVGLWGAAYRETVTTAAPGTLIVPPVIAQRPASSGFEIADLEAVLPQLTREVSAAPNVSVVPLVDIAAGRAEDPVFVEAMRAAGFAVSGVAAYPDPDAGAASQGAGAGTRLGDLFAGEA